MVIRTPDYHLRVFVSSTLKELAEERKAVRQSILKLRLAPVMFESGARPHPAQELYKSYLSQSQVFIGIYWKSYGWVGPEMKISGLEDEYNLSVEKPRLIYIKNPAPDREPALSTLLDRIRNDNTASYTYFSTLSELKELVQNDLALLLTERFESVGITALSSTTVSPALLTNVPIPRNLLIGRESELLYLYDLLQRDDTALITLTGAGGTGKSRLALQIGHDILASFCDGVYIVRLEPISDPDLVISTIAKTFDLRETPESLPINDMLREFLREKQMLLILDNFEQVVEASPSVGELLEACPKLKCIVTSRTPLHLRIEREFPVPPLSVPEPQKPNYLENLSQYAAVELFIQRAQAVKPDFEVTNASAPSVAEICYRLDGLPLAIELAASKIKMFSPQGLLGRLENRFDVLKGGTRDLPERQRTLRGAIDWSYNLLNDPEKLLLRRLSVFTDGSTLEAVETVCDFDGDLSDQLDDLLESLIDNNLVIQLEGTEDEPRFGMSSTIHDYTWERLAESDENDRIHQKHAEFYLAFATAVEPLIRSAEREKWQKVLQNDFGNIRAVLAWVTTQRMYIETGQRLFNAIGNYWLIGGFILEGRQWSDKLLALCSDSTPVLVRAGLLCYQGMLAWAQGELMAATQALEICLQLCRTQPGETFLPYALTFSAMIASTARDLDTAFVVYQEAITYHKENNDLWFLAICLSWLADVVLYQNDLQRAQELRAESIRIARIQGDPWCLMPALIGTAQLSIVEGDLDTAHTNLTEVVELLHRTGDNWSMSWTITDLAYVALLRNNLSEAGDCIVECLALAKSYGNLRASIIALIQAAELISLIAEDPGKSDYLLAAQLCGATAPYINSQGIFLWFDTKKLYDDGLAQTKSLVPPTVWEKGFTSGQNLPVDEAITLALDRIRAFKPEKQI
jgi:predicted ATPase